MHCIGPQRGTQVIINIHIHGRMDGWTYKHTIYKEKLYSYKYVPSFSLENGLVGFSLDVWFCVLELIVCRLEMTLEPLEDPMAALALIILSSSRWGHSSPISSILIHKSSCCFLLCLTGRVRPWVRCCNRQTKGQNDYRICSFIRRIFIYLE